MTEIPQGQSYTIIRPSATLQPPFSKQVRTTNPTLSSLAALQLLVNVHLQPIREKGNIRLEQMEKPFLRHAAPALNNGSHIQPHSAFQQFLCGRNSTAYIIHLNIALLMVVSLYLGVEATCLNRWQDEFLLRSPVLTSEA